MKQGHSLGQRSFSEFRYRVEANGVEVEPAGLVKGEPNRVSTTRFTVLTWLPKSLFLQFQRVANIYFLFIAVIVCMPFSTKRWQSKVFPYLLVLAWTALKDLYEDMQRRKDNRMENARSCWRFNWELKEFEQIAWRLVKPGDFVCTLCDEAFPADLLVLSAADGHAFVSTVNLDGETNLKLRTAPKVFSSLQMKNEGASLSAVPSELASLVSEVCRQQLHVRLATPCADLAEMNALVSFPGTEDVGSIDYAACDSFAPRGCVLRNTSWLLSIAAYTGIHTKQCLNSAKVSGKVSNMQALLNRCVYGLLAFLILTCCYLATAAKSISVHTNWPERFLAYTITLYHVVPISLYVAFEVLKLILGRFIDSDQQMVDKAGIGAKARTADLVEELGQIDFIFSDKTGTLTANEMRFARCAVGDVVFGPFIADPLGGPVLGQLQVKDILGEPSEPSEPSEQSFAQNVLWFFICLSVCHTVQVNSVKDMQYSGPSPDEVALVEGANSVGVSLKSRRKTELQKEEIVVSAPSIGSGENRGKGRVTDHVFVVLHTIEFSAERKRMSVLCQHEGVIHCITKGADIALATLLTSKLGAKEEDQLRFFSEMGLRTLVVASKTVDPSAFASWESQWLTAKGSLESRTERLAECGAMIEKDLQLVGISAVEDRLQEGVPTAIARLKDAGIRLWVLTGDKTETAVDIAYSCNLFSQGMELIFLTNSADVAAASERLATAEKSIKGDSNCGLVIDGRTLQFILEDHDSSTTFYKLAMSSTSCVCTRFSPSQKRRLVDEVRKRGSSITLAIGDGANDVPMILGAHVGIGLRGKEGSQAVQASDIAISQFAFLVPLLLCHGRRAYRRVASFLCYYFYKNVALAFGDFIWAHQNSFSGEVAYPEWLSTSFNAVFTWWPVIIVLAFDQDIPDSISNAQPRIYTEGIKREWFNIRLFALWMTSAAFQGSLAWILPNFLFGSFDYEAVDFWRASATSFTMVIVIVALKLALHDFKRCSLSCLLPIIGSIASYIIVLFLLGYVPLGQRMQPNLAGDPPVPGWIFSNATPILVIALASPLALLPDAMALLWVRKLHPSPLFQIRSKNL